MFSLWRKARRENSAASRLLGSTSLRFALHGWQRWHSGADHLPSAGAGLGSAESKRVFGLVIDFGTSQSPKSTRPLTTYLCPSRPGHQALRNNFASSLLLRTWLPYDWTPRSEAYFVFPLAQGTPGKQCCLAAAGDYLPSLRSPWLSAAAIDRIIHHATILEIDGNSYRRKHQKKIIIFPHTQPAIIIVAKPVKISVQSVGQRHRPVHPHGCGEHQQTRLIRSEADGSSPRVWGTLPRACARVRG